MSLLIEKSLEFIAICGGYTQAAPFTIHGTKYYPLVLPGAAGVGAALPQPALASLTLDDSYTENWLYLYVFADMSGASTNAQWMRGQINLYGPGGTALRVPLYIGNTTHSGGTDQGSSYSTYPVQGADDGRNAIQLWTGYSIAGEPQNILLQPREFTNTPLNQLTVDITTYGLASGVNSMDVRVWVGVHQFNK